LRILSIKTLTLFLLLYFSTEIYATSLLINSNETTYHFIENIELHQEDPQNISIQEIQNKPFLPYENWKNQLEPNQIYWGKFQLQNKQDSPIINEDWVITFPYLLTEIDVFIPTSKGNYTILKTGSFIPFSQRNFVPIVKGNFINFKIKNNEKITIYFRAKCDRKNATPKFNIQLSSSHFFYNNLNQQKQNRGLFTGFVIMMLVYNLLLFFFNAKDKAYVFYSFYLFHL